MRPTSYPARVTTPRHPTHTLWIGDEIQPGIRQCAITTRVDVPHLPPHTVRSALAHYVEATGAIANVMQVDCGGILPDVIAAFAREVAP